MCQSLVGDMSIDLTNKKLKTFWMVDEYLDNMPKIKIKE